MNRSPEETHRIQFFNIMSGLWGFSKKCLYFQLKKKTFLEFFPNFFQNHTRRIFQIFKKRKEKAKRKEKEEKLIHLY